MLPAFYQFDVERTIHLDLRTYGYFITTMRNKLLTIVYNI